MTQEEKMQVIERLRDIAGKRTAEITEDDKWFVTMEAEAFGVAIKTKGRCKNCFRDAALLVYNAIKGEEVQEVSESEDGPRYVLKKGVNVFFGGVLVNEATMTDALAERIIARGFSKQFFEKMPEK